MVGNRVNDGLNSVQRFTIPEGDTPNLVILKGGKYGKFDYSYNEYTMFLVFSFPTEGICLIIIIYISKTNQKNPFTSSRSETAINLDPTSAGAGSLVGISTSSLTLSEDLLKPSGR